jgi:hypothetical protein
VPGFFSKVLGSDGSGVLVLSTATVQNYTIRGSRSVDGFRPHILPIALNKANYDAMMAEQIEVTKRELGEGDLTKLLHAGDTWAVD